MQPDSRSDWHVCSAPSPRANCVDSVRCNARAQDWKPGDVCLWHHLGATSSSEPRALPLKVSKKEALAIHFQEPTPHAPSYLYGTLQMQLLIRPIIRDKTAFYTMIDRYAYDADRADLCCRHRLRGFQLSAPQQA